MIDTDCFGGVMEVLSVIDHSRRPTAHSSDEFGNCHIVLFGSSAKAYTTLFLLCLRRGE